MSGLIEHHNKIICDSYGNFFDSLTLSLIVNMLFRITGKKILKKKDGIPSPMLNEGQKKHVDFDLISKLNKSSQDMQKHMSEYDFIKAFENLS